MPPSENRKPVGVPPSAPLKPALRTVSCCWMAFLERRPSAPLVKTWKYTGIVAVNGRPESGASSIGGFFQALGSRWPARAAPATAGRPPSVGAKAPQLVSGAGAATGAAWAVFATTAASRTAMTETTARIRDLPELTRRTVGGTRCNGAERVRGLTRRQPPLTRRLELRFTWPSGPVGERR